MDPFLAIRPYQDNEVQDVLDSLISNKDVLKSLMGLQYPKYLTKIPFFRSAVKILLRSKVKKIRTIDDYQEIFKGLMDQMIKTSISNFTVSGIENLDTDSSYLFICFFFKKKAGENWSSGTNIYYVFSHFFYN